MNSKFFSLHLPTTDTPHHTTPQEDILKLGWLHACWLPSGQAEWCQTIRVSSLLVLPWMNPKLYLIYPLLLILAWTRSQRELLCCRHSLSFPVCSSEWEGISEEIWERIQESSHHGGLFMTNTLPCWMSVTDWTMQLSRLINIWLEFHFVFFFWPNKF